MVGSRKPATTIFVAERMREKDRGKFIVSIYRTILHAHSPGGLVCKMKRRRNQPPLSWLCSLIWGGWKTTEVVGNIKAAAAGAYCTYT